MGMVRSDGDPGTWFAGSHGFDVLQPDGKSQELDEGAAALPALDAAERRTRRTARRHRGGPGGAQAVRHRRPLPLHARRSHRRPRSDRRRRRRIARRVAHDRWQEDLRAATRHRLAQGQGRPLVDRSGRARRRSPRWRSSSATTSPTKTDSPRCAAAASASSSAPRTATAAAHLRLDDPDATRQLLENPTRMLAES